MLNGAGLYPIPKQRCLVSPATYAILYPCLVAVARKFGYALAVHGSLTRDMDLLAVPWSEEAGHPKELMDAFRSVCGGVFVGTHYDSLDSTGNPSIKPHRRVAWSIHLTDEGMYGPYLDVSVMLRAQDKPEDFQKA